VLTTVLTRATANAISTARSVPNTTRPFLRSLWTVAYFSSLASTFTGF
jgi:hypothetical protein